MPHHRDIDRENLRRLANILARTQSDYDGEVLAAARKARVILQKYNMGYEDLILKSTKQEDQRLVDEIIRLQRQLAGEQRKADALAAALRQARADRSGGEGRPLLKSLEQLRTYLMGHFMLKKHERELLERIEDPKPKSKEAHIVLICAQRYGVAFS
ncbi:MAG: hypothetical protein HWE25_05670 [Alphaproteobacteria bacterium]|nr:hypothetical protein [Alphaproteobacteria bacterium]